MTYTVQRRMTRHEFNTIMDRVFDRGNVMDQNNSRRLTATEYNWIMGRGGLRSPIPGGCIEINGKRTHYMPVDHHCGLCGHLLPDPLANRDAPQAVTEKELNDHGGSWHDMRGPHTDHNFTRLLQFIHDVASEVLRARQKFPSSYGVMCALTEEVGEVAKACMDYPLSEVRKEAVQVAAMAARLALEGDPSLQKIRDERHADSGGE